MATKRVYDIAIIGGGLGGLCLAIQLATKGLDVVLFEKNEYPFHKVCGEYISMESWDFLERIGLPLSNWQLPKINELGISSTRGFMLNTRLDLGGFGISRYTLDKALCDLARSKGVSLLEACKVSRVEYGKTYSLQTSQGIFEARLVVGAYGRTTPSFMQKVNPPSRAYIGVKYHIQTDVVADNRIELHNFEGGYCGISKVDKDTFCLCYLSLVQNLKNAEHNIKKMEEQVLHKNPYINTIFERSTFLYSKPLVITNISFQAKSTVNNQILTLGDAAGSIAPLCGNGMSMAMRASTFLARACNDFIVHKVSQKEIEERYTQEWSLHFKHRIKAGFYLQNLFGHNRMTHSALKTLDYMPNVLQKLIHLTHGSPF